MTGFTAASADRLIEIRRRTLHALQGRHGWAWRTVSGELHLQTLEMPTWIDLDAASHLEAAHQAFTAIVSPHFGAMGAVNATVSYSVGDKLLVMLETNAEITMALQADYLRRCTLC